MATPAATDQRASIRSIRLATARPTKPLVAKNTVDANDAENTEKPRSRVRASSSTDWL